MNMRTLEKKIKFDSGLTVDIDQKVILENIKTGIRIPALVTIRDSGKVTMSICRPQTMIDGVTHFKVEGDEIKYIGFTTSPRVIDMVNAAKESTILIKV